MKNKIKKNSYKELLLSYIAILFFVCFPLQGNQRLIVFDSFFPTTWYEKGLNSIMYVWHKACCMVENKEVVSIDVLLGRVAYVQFCFAKMYEEHQPVLDEDIVYVHLVVDTCKNILSTMSDDTYDEDRMLCLYTMIENIKKKLRPQN